MVLVTYRTEVCLHGKTVGIVIKNTWSKVTVPRFKTQTLHLRVCDLEVTYPPMCKALTHIFYDIVSAQ